MRWFEQQRLEWIAETLRVFGFINREHLMREFGISQPQASNDLAAFQRAHPKAMVYDVSAKRYQARANAEGDRP
jgi:hypothetical protein